MTSKVCLIVDLVVVLGCDVSTGAHWTRLLACLEPGSPPGSHVENILAAEEGPKEWLSELVRRAAYVGCVLRCGDWARRRASERKVELVKSDIDFVVGFVESSVMGWEWARR